MGAYAFVGYGRTVQYAGPCLREWDWSNRFIVMMDAIEIIGESKAEQVVMHSQTFCTHPSFTHQAIALFILMCV